MTWNDAQKFCEWLSKKEGKTFELPREAEWEYACRAGTTTRYWCGDAEESLKGNANVADAALKHEHPTAKETLSWDDGYPFTSPVGKFNANPWVLFDMHGNVWQWCLDYHGMYQEGYSKDPKGPDSGGSRILRGGSWGSNPGNCRSAHRFSLAPGDRRDDIGFRVVLRVAPTAP